MSESYERLEQQFNDIVAKQAAPVAEVIAGGHGPLHAVIRWLRDPMPPGTLLMPVPAGAQEFCRFPDCKCPMDPGPEPDWCAKGLPHARGVDVPLAPSSEAKLRQRIGKLRAALQQMEEGGGTDVAQEALEEDDHANG